MKIVLDTNILISAALFKGSTLDQAFRYVISNHTLLISEDCFSELTATLRKPKLIKFSTPKDRAKFLNNIQNAGTFIIPNITIDECRDSKDNKFLELAVAGNADCIVTGDKDLLVLNPFCSIPIITAVDFINQY